MECPPVGREEFRTRCRRDPRTAPLAGLRPAGRGHTRHPPRRHPAHGRLDAEGVEAAGFQQPGDERVRVPHVPDTERIASPDVEGYGAEPGRDLACRPIREWQPQRGRRSVGTIRQDTVLPAADLVAEQTRSAEQPHPHRTRGHHAVRGGVGAPRRRHLDHAAPPLTPDLERGMEQGSWRAPFATGTPALPPPTRVDDHVAARADGKPPQIGDGAGREGIIVTIPIRG